MKADPAAIEARKPNLARLRVDSTARGCELPARRLAAEETSRWLFWLLGGTAALLVTVLAAVGAYWVKTPVHGECRGAECDCGFAAAEH